MMLRVLEQNGDQYFQYLTSTGWKLPPNFDFQQIFQKRVLTKVEIFRGELHKMNQHPAQMEMANETPKTSFVDTICALPFHQSLYMVPFPRDIEVPKYDKYDGNGDPHDHVHQFYTLSMDFVHEDTFLLRLFPRSIRDQAMEWFTKISPPLQTFDELVRCFTQQYSYNI